METDTVTASQVWVSQTRAQRTAQPEGTGPARTRLLPTLLIVYTADPASGRFWSHRSSRAAGEARKFGNTLRHSWLFALRGLRSDPELRVLVISPWRAELSLRDQQLGEGGHLLWRKGQRGFWELN